MNSEGYIRKIDELGRIVIPKEIRNKLKIQDNENIFINCSNNEAIIQKYSYILNNKNYLEKFGNLISENLKIDVQIYDRDKLIFEYNNNGYLNKYEEEIIVNSIVIGKIIIFTDKTDDFYNKICKTFANILAISLII
jgi:AbrB family looped-hinge helix DNA binding protein